MNMPNDFYPMLGGNSLKNPHIPDPGGSQSGFIVQSIYPGLNKVKLNDGSVVLTDENGNIIG